MDSEYVLDASAFYAGIPFLSSVRCHTTDQVFDEVKHIKKSHSALEALMDAGRLTITEPDKENVEKAAAAAKATGDYQRLSAADISILALALQLQQVLVSDDYAVANVASALRISVKPAGTKGIKESRKWVSYCSACGKGYGPEAKECPLCGNMLSRRYKKLR